MVEYEDKLARLQAEKAKAEQKYFSTMKSKDQIQGENRALKQQLAKTAEVITKVQEGEKSLNQKMVFQPLRSLGLISQGVIGSPASSHGEHSRYTGKETS